MPFVFSRVAVLTHYFSPLDTVQVNRLEAFCRFFRSHGLEVLVLTRYWQPGDVLGIEAGEAYDRPISEEVRSDGVTVRRYPLSSANPTHRWPGGHRFWGKGLGFALLSATGRLEHTQDFTFGQEPDLIARLREFRTDFLLASLPMHYLAAATEQLASELGIPYWLDFRDLHNNERMQRHPRIGLRRQVLDFLAVKTLRRACSGARLVTSISAPFVEYVRQVYRARTVHILTNGYEQELFSDLRKVEVDTSVFRVVYTGSLYPAQLHPVWLEGFSRFVQAVGTDRVLFQFFGTAVVPAVVPVLKATLPGASLEITDRMPRRQALEASARASVLFYPGWVGYRGIYSGKIFEYLGLRRPILLAPSDGDVLEALLRETGAGYVCHTAAEVCQVLLDLYSRHQAGTRIPYAANEQAIEGYSREAQMASTWERFVGGGSGTVR